MCPSRFVSPLAGDCVQRFADRCHTDKRGNRVLIAICVLNMVLYLFTYLFYRGINKRRERTWDSWTAKVADMHHSLSANALTLFLQEQQEYLDTTKDEVRSSS